VPDTPGEGFEVGAAFVQVSPEAEDFQGEVEALVTGTDIVVTVPVVPDGAGFREKLAGEVDAGDTAVMVPVRPETSGFRMLLQDELGAQEPITIPVVPDAAGFRDKVAAEVAGSDTPLEVPLIPDAAGFAGKVSEEAATAGEDAGAAFRDSFDSTAGKQLAMFDTGTLDAEAGTAGEEAGTAFREKFSSVAGQMSMFGTGTIEAEAATAGEEAGTAFTERFASVATRVTPFSEMFTEAGAEAATAGETAGVAYESRFAAMAGRMPWKSVIGDGAAAEAGTAAEDAGTEFSGRFSGLLSKMQGLSGAIPGLVSEAEQGAEKAGSGFMGKLKGVISGEMPPIEALIPAAFVAASAVMASKFQSAMERIHTQAGVGQSAIHGLSSDVLNLAAKVGESPDSLSESLYHVESAFQSNGIKSSAALHDVQIAAEGARTGGADLLHTTYALTALMKSGLVGGANSAAQAMGALNSIVGSGDMTMQDFTEALGSGLVAQAPLYHQSITQVGAALATLGDSNIRGAKAATDLRMAWQAIQSPLTTSAAALQHLGLTSTTLADTMVHHGMSAAIDQFVEHLKASHVPMGEWGQYVTEIFGKRAGAGIGVLTEQFGNLQLKLGTVAHGVHDFGNAWADTQQTTDQKMHDMLAGFESLMIEIGSKVLPVLGDFFGAIAKALPGIERFGSQVAHLIAPTVHTFFANLKDVIGMLVGDIEGWLPKFKTLGEIIAALVLPAVGLFFTGLGGILKFLLGPMKDLTLAVGLAIGVWTALNLVLAINPFVAIGVGLVILVGLIIKYHKQIWDVIKGAWDHILSFLKDWWPLLLGVVTGGLGLVIAVVVKYHTQIFDAIHDAWDHVLNFVKGWWPLLIGVITGPLGIIVGLIIKYHGQIFDAIKTAWDKVTAFLSSTWNTITSGIRTAWDAITSFFTSWWSGTGSSFSSGISAIESVLSSAWNDITSTIKTAWDAITSFFTDWWDLLTGQFTPQQIKTLESLLSTAWDDITSAIKTAWNTIESWLTTWWDTDKRLVTDALSALKSLLTGAWATIKSDTITVWDDITSFFSKVWSGLTKGFNDVVAGIKTAWGKLKSIFEDPVKFLVDTVYDNGIARLWNDVAGKIPGIPKMPIISMAGGGKLPGYGGGDSVPALLEPGETVVSKEHSTQLAGAFSAVGVPGYAKGGIISGIGGVLGGIGHAIGGAVGKLVSSVETGSITALKDALRAVVKTTASGPLGTMLTQIPETMISDMVKGVIHKIESIIPGGGGHETAAEGQIASWWQGAGGPGGDTAKIAAAITGAESSFNVKAIQQGQPYNSTGWGLWQITPGNSEPSAGIDDQLLTGPSNAKAAVLKYRGAGDSFSPWTTYMDGAYKAFLASGGLIPPAAASIPQSRWYDQGGWLASGGSAVNASGSPEAVLTPQESAAFVQLVKALVSRGGGMASGDMAGAGAQVNVNYYGTQAPTPEQEQAMLLKLGSLIGVA
jgi:TP901 family phage tail tape measure protein